MVTALDKINYLNIALMIASLLLAFLLPFELFLFSYAVLGPLHYLTQISWMNNRGYFVKNKNDMWGFLLLTFLLTLGLIIGKGSIFANFTGSLFFVAFCYGLIIIFIRNFFLKIGLVLAAFLFSIIFDFNNHGNNFILFAILMPTIIHVFFFTGFFILAGNLKNKSRSGNLALIIFILCAICTFLAIPVNSNYITSDYAKSSYFLFSEINFSLFKIFGINELASDFNQFYSNPSSLAIMRFIAFAYTYHYLNWFSKTRIIEWHKISPTVLSLIIVGWIFSLLIYGLNYYAGYILLFFLSILHVFLEFPLNYQTIIFILRKSFRL